MMRNLLLLVVVLVLISGSLSCGAGKSDVSGTYVCTQASEVKGPAGSEFTEGYILELKKDGTLYWHSPGQPGVSGNWKVDGSEVLLSTEFFGMTWKGEIQGETVVLEDGSIWKKEKEDAMKPTSPTSTPETATPTPTSPAVTPQLPPGTISIGDFTIALSSVAREETVAILSFVVTKVSDSGADTLTVAIVLTDDHDNTYQGTLDIKPEGSPDNLLLLLPMDFTYVASLDIKMPKAAPIEKIRLGKQDEITYQSLHFAKPSLDKRLDKHIIELGRNFSAGKHLNVSIDPITSDVLGWITPFTVNNGDYNPVEVSIMLGMQLSDGEVTFSEKGGFVIEVSGSSLATLRPRLSFSQVREALRLIAIFKDGSTGEYTLKLMNVNHQQFDEVPERIAFEDVYTIYIMNADGSDKTELAMGHAPAWSPDGSKIAFVHQSAIYVSDADGSGVTRLATGFNPTWSPDGRSIAFDVGIKLDMVAGTEGAIYIINIDGSGLKKLVDSSHPLNAPAWSPDGKKLAFAENLGGGTFYLYVMNADGSGKTKLADGSGPKWSPDGRRIVFEDRWASTIYLINADGSGKIELFEYSSNPAWSPDGSKIIFDYSGRLLSTSLGTRAICVINTDGSGLTKLGEGIDPEWAPAFRLGSQISTHGSGLTQVPSPAPAPAPVLEKYADSFDYPIRDDNPNDKLQWSIVQGFGELYAEMGGYHSGEDWNLMGGRPDADLGKPVYAVGNGQIKKISFLGSLGYLVAIEHQAASGRTFTIPSKGKRSYIHPNEDVTKIISVYVHIMVDESKIYEGAWIKKGSSIGTIMNPGGGPHLHFEIRHPAARHSNNWSMIGDKSNWAIVDNKVTGYYLDVQQMVYDGLRHPSEFIEANYGEEATTVSTQSHPWPMVGHDAQNTFYSPYEGPESPSIKWDVDLLHTSSAPLISTDGTIYLTTLRDNNTIVITVNRDFPYQL